MVLIVENRCSQSQIWLLFKNFGSLFGGAEAYAAALQLGH
jgi:hypothetical protein